MFIVAANLSAEYSGRGTTFLAPYDRIIMMKSDGSISIHNEKSVKPINYMPAKTIRSTTTNDIGEQVWIFANKKEQLIITLHKIFDTIDISLGDNDPGLQHEGTEDHLQEWLAQNITVLHNDLIFVAREFETGAGPVDILAEKPSGEIVAIEVKRTAHINTVGQIARYLDALKEYYPNKTIIGIIAALEIKNKTIELAEKKNIECVVVPSDWNISQTNPKLSQTNNNSLNLFELLD